MILCVRGVSFKVAESSGKLCKDLSVTSERLVVCELPNCWFLLGLSLSR